jgi:hypothetical protein
MSNLIPPQAHTQVKNEYRLRVLTVWLVLFGSACLVVAVLNAPLYVLIRGQLDAYLTEFAQANVESESFKESEVAVTRANTIGILLSGTKKQEVLSDVIAEIESQSGDGISLTEVELSRNEDGTLKPIILKGIADSRLSLTTFQANLEKHALFKKANLPLSNLAQDRDISFSITLEPEITAQ